MKAMIASGGFAEGFYFYGPYVDLAAAESDAGGGDEILEIEAPHGVETPEGEYIVLLGGPWEGFSPYGPFIDTVKASTWAVLNCNGEPYFLHQLRPVGSNALLRPRTDP